MIRIYNRNSKCYEEEKVAGGGILKTLYETPQGKLSLEILIKRKIFSALNGLIFDLKLSRKKIKSFIEEYNIDVSNCCDKVSDYESFNSFFTRRLKLGSEMFRNSAENLFSPGDGRLRAYVDIDIDKLVQVKGSFYTLKELLQNNSLAEKYRNGICLILRLAPVDYHRFHFIDSGVCKATNKIKGFYYSVNPIALSSISDVFLKNKREYSIFKSEHFGDIIYMEVGATSVGTIIQTYMAGEQVSAGDEKGYFRFGGSTIILFLEKGKAMIDRDIIEQTGLGFETKVLAGEKIGSRCQQ